MKSRGLLWLIVAGGLPLVASGQDAPRMAPVPDDPLELVAGQVPVAATGASRKAALQLLARARDNYAFRSVGRGYDLKINFAVDSLGQTDYDGDWQMEDVFLPGQGLHWTARAAAGYSIARISSKKELYAEGTANEVPFRLQEARGMLYHPLPSAAYANRESIRTSAAIFRGAPVTCVLLSNTKTTAVRWPGRAWEESEECIDPQSGLLQVHSETPGRYIVYEYSNILQIGGHMLPRSVTVTEAGRIVTRISVETLEEITVADPGLFIPSDRMKAKGRAAPTTGLTKISRVHGQGPFTSAMTVRAVCVIGMVAPTGKLVEAHSLQPSDPNSQAAVEDAQGIDFSPSTPAGALTAQHFVLVIEKFVSPQ